MGSTDDYELELFIKASKDGKGLGDCIHCHRFMMVLALKGVTANVTTIDLKRKPEFFAKNYAGVKLPCLVHNGRAIDDVIEIESHIERNFPDPPLVVDDKGALKAGDKVFLKFSGWIRNKVPSNEDKLRQLLVEELQRLNVFLSGSGKIPGTYLAGSEMTMSDCILLPKLHQLRVSLEFFKDFTLPEEQLPALRDYLAASDSNDVFSRTCCDDAEILEGWSKHVGDPKKAMLIHKRKR